MAQIDNAVTLLAQVGQCVERASEEDDGSYRERYWNDVAQIQATSAVAAALIAIHETLQRGTARLAQ
jgi:hypothetical protein